MEQGNILVLNGGRASCSTSKPKRCGKASGPGHAQDLSPRTSYQRAAHFERVCAIISRVLIKRVGQTS